MEAVEIAMITVHVATLDDINYIDHLQRKNAEELSFYPKAVFDREVQVGRILLARLNGEPCGYLYHGAMRPRCKIYQACIQYDARGELYGAALVGWLLDMAKQAGVYSMHLRCGSDIMANNFWHSVGFYCEGVHPGGIRRMRDINCWRYDLVDDLFQNIMEPSSKAQDASVWRKRGDISAGSQFIRGRALTAYRDLILSGNDEN